MASFNAGVSFSDGVSNDVTAAKLGQLVTAATPTSGFIQDRTAETVTATNDTLLIGDASDSNNLKRITVANFAQTLPTLNVTTGTIATGTIPTGTFGTTTATAESVTTGTIVNGTFGTTTSTAATITTGTIPTLVATTAITTGTGTAAAPAIAPTGDSNNGLFFPAADTIAATTNGTERVRIDSSGNVAIGQNTATAKLTVTHGSTSGSGTVAQLGGGSGGSDPRGLTIKTFTSNSGGDCGVEFNAAINNSGFGAFAFSAGTNERLRIDSSGNVGIGTSSPATKLHVVGEVNLPDGDALKWGNSGNYITGSGSSNAVLLATNSIERLRIDSSGNVGCGTTTPIMFNAVGSASARLLTVYNSGTSSANRGEIQIGNAATASGTTVGAIVFGCGASSSNNLSSIISETDGTSTTNAVGRLIFNTSSASGPTERLRIDSNGLVGIGTSSAVNKLEIVGSFGRGAPVTKTGDFTLADTENWLIVNKGSSCTVTLPAASSWTGREFTIKVITAHTVISASSNVVPRSSATAGTAILAATAGAWATLVSNGTNWVIMCGS